MFKRFKSFSIKPEQCPDCGSNKIADIYYGYPPLKNERLKLAIDNQEIILGGCCITDFDPHWECVGCGSQFKNSTKPKVSELY